MPASRCDPDEAAEALLERHRRATGREYCVKPLPPSRSIARAAGGDDRIVGRRERDLVEDDEPERPARDVDALPEAHRRDEHGLAARAEARQEQVLGALALDHQRQTSIAAAEARVEAPASRASRCTGRTRRRRSSSRARRCARPPRRRSAGRPARAGRRAGRAPRATRSRRATATTSSPASGGAPRRALAKWQLVPVASVALVQTTVGTRSKRRVAQGRADVDGARAERDAARSHVDPPHDVRHLAVVARRALPCEDALAGRREARSRAAR